MTAQQQATAVLAALNAALTPKVAYDLDKVPATRPAEYVEVTVSRRHGGEFRQCGDIGTVGYRVTVRAISRVSVSNVRASLEKCRSALEFASLTVGDESTTPIQFETEDPAGYDDGWFSGLVTFTYVI